MWRKYKYWIKEWLHGDSLRKDDQMSVKILLMVVRLIWNLSTKQYIFSIKGFVDVNEHPKRQVDFMS
jgi:hypothetical protein